MKLYTQILTALSAILIIAGTATAGDPSNTVAIFTASSNRSVTDIAEQLDELLRQDDVNVVVYNTGLYDFTDAPEAGVLVAVGDRSSNTVTRHYPDHRVLSIRTAPDENSGYGHAELLLEQPLCRQLLLIEQLSEQFRSVGIISSRARHREALRTCPAATRLKVELLQQVPDESVNSLITRALDNDVLLATPDRDIFNSRTIKNVLLLSYRQRIPVIGFSRSFVDAGAMAGLHTTPEQVALQAREIIGKLLRNRTCPGQTWYPDDFTIAVNNQVSKSLGFVLPDTNLLRCRIESGDSDE